MKFHTYPAIRYYAGSLSLLIFFIIPVYMFLETINNKIYPLSEYIYLVIFAGVIAIGCIMLFYFALLEKCFAYIVISDNAISLKCPLRKTITIKRAECISVGLECETTPVPGEFAYIYFASIPYPSKAERKKVVARSRKGLIKFRYTPELGEYVVKEFAPITTYTLCSYQRISKKQK